MQGVSAKLAAVAVGMLLAPSAIGADEPVDQPPVVVHRYTVGEIFVYCAGIDCLDAFSGIGGNPWVVQDISISSEGGSTTSEQFCSALKSKRPSGCDASNPPSTPGTDPNWQPSGCGTGPILNAVLSFGLSRLYTDNYSGDFQAPFTGVSFQSACNAHDACWGVGSGRGHCDDKFHESMRKSCDVVVSADSRSVCNGFAAAYFSAVSASDVGNETYARAVSDRRCALWAFDMKSNGCK